LTPQDYRLLHNIRVPGDIGSDGVTITEPLLADGIEAPETSANIYWTDPEQELKEKEQFGRNYASPPVEDATSISMFSSGCVAVTSRNNASVFVAGTQVHPGSYVEEFRDWPSILDVSVFGLVIVVLHSDRRVRLYHARPLRLSTKRTPRFTFGDDDKFLAMDPVRSWQQPAPLRAGRFIWQNYSRCVVQMPDATLVQILGMSSSAIEHSRHKQRMAKAAAVLKNVHAKNAETAVQAAREAGVEPAVLASAARAMDAKK
jgi:hypothetical protein